MSDSKMKIAYVVTQRGTQKYWTRVGVAFVNKDGSLTVRLEAIPVNGEIHIRDYEGAAPILATEIPSTNTSREEDADCG